ncbi:hypothetical protein C922_00311 [Plasmodium inui San Antonio 1]|uniref:Calponin-homology (CH) domain-containing protein n=1 Tax=Plasmodium inui San Antonio 1 TaxID=1237626 RepID=W7ADQ5_9APIC|nr:hypothetical protein C922_00311 [Plasmodium inui San Antonio 1]EUD69448.1 hypothetical protein C922_00311 [Plasmodium inui San Antonio 1]
MEKNKKIGKEQLVCWVEKMLKRKPFHFSDLKDGGVYVDLFQCIWPQMMKKYEERYQHRDMTKEKEKTNWIIINCVLNDLKIDSDFISYSDIGTGHFSRCYESLIVLFFLHSLVEHHECDFVLAYPVTKKLTDFMSSEEPLNCLIRAGSLQLPQNFCDDFSNSVQGNNVTGTNGEERESPFDMGGLQNCVPSKWTHESHHSDLTNELDYPYSASGKKSTLVRSREFVPTFADRFVGTSADTSANICTVNRDKSFPHRRDSLLSLISSTSTVACSSTGWDRARDTSERGTTTKERGHPPLCNIADVVSHEAAYQGKATTIKCVEKSRIAETITGEKRLNNEATNEDPIRCGNNVPYSFDQMVSHPRSNFFKYFNKREVGRSGILEKGPHDHRKSDFFQSPHLNCLPLPPPNSGSISGADDHKDIHADVKKTKVDASCQAENDPLFNFLLNDDSVRNLKVTWNDEEKNVKGESFIWFLKTQMKKYKREVRLREEELEVTSQMKNKEIEDVKMAHSIQLAMLREKQQAEIFSLKQQHLDEAAKIRKHFEAKICNIEEDLTLDLDVLHCQEKDSLLSNLPDEKMEWRKSDEEETRIPKHGNTDRRGRQDGRYVTDAADTPVDYDEEDANINRFLFEQVDMGSVISGGGSGRDHYYDDIPRKRKFLTFDYCLENGKVGETPEEKPEGEHQGALYTGTDAELTGRTSGGTPRVETHTSSNIREAINKMKKLVSRRNMEHQMNNEQIRGEIATLRNAVENFQCRRGGQFDLVTETAQFVSELLQSIDREEEQPDQGEEEKGPPRKGWDTFSYIEKEQNKIYEMIKKGHNGLLKNDQVVKILDGSSLIRLLVRLVCALKLERVKRRLVGQRMGSKEASDRSSEKGSDKNSQRSGETGVRLAFASNDIPSNEIDKIEHEMKTDEHIKNVERKNKRLQCLNEYYKKRLGHLEVWANALEDLKSKCKKFYRENGRHAFINGGEERALHEFAEVPPSGDPSDEAVSSEPLPHGQLPQAQLPPECVSMYPLASSHPLASLSPFLWSPKFYLRSFTEENERDAELMHLLKLLGRGENEEDVLLFQSSTPMRCPKSDNEVKDARGGEENSRQSNPDKLNLSVCPTEALLKKKLTYNFWRILGDMYTYRNVIIEACHYICHSNGMMNKYILTSEEKMKRERRQFEEACNGKDTVHMAERYKWRQLLGRATLNRDIYKGKYFQLEKEIEKERKNLLYLTNVCYEEESVKYKNTILQFRQVDHNYRVYKAREKKWVQLAKLLITELTNSSKDNQQGVMDVWLEIVATEKGKKRKQKEEKKKENYVQAGNFNWETHIEECMSNDACEGVAEGTSHLTSVRRVIKEVENLRDTHRGGKNKMKGTLTNCARDHVGMNKGSRTTNRGNTTTRRYSGKFGSASKGGRKSVHSDGSNSHMYRQDDSLCKQASPPGRGSNRTSAEQDEEANERSQSNRSGDYFTGMDVNYKRDFKGSGANYYTKDFHTFLNDVQSSCVLNFSSASESDIWVSEEERIPEPLHSGGDNGEDGGSDLGVGALRLAASKSAVQTANHDNGANQSPSPGGEPWETRLKHMAEESCTMFQRILCMKEEEITQGKKQMEHLEGELNEMKKEKQSQENKYACLQEQQNDLVKRLGSLRDIISDLNDQMYKMNREKICSENESLARQQQLHTILRNYECTIELIKSHLKKYPSVLCLLDTVADGDKEIILEVANAGENYNRGVSLSLQVDKHAQMKEKQNCLIKRVAWEEATDDVSQVMANLEGANMSIGGEDKCEGIPDFSLTDLMRDMGWDN